MPLLDPNLKTIIGTKPKLHWKDYFRGDKERLDLKDQHETYLGKFQMEVSNVCALYNSDGSVLLRLSHSGIFRKKVEIRDSENNLLAKKNRKLGLASELIWLENSKGEKILKCKDGLTIPFLDQNENLVAELKLRRFKSNFMLSIHDLNFDRKMILGLTFELFRIHNWVGGSEGGGN